MEGERGGGSWGGGRRWAVGHGVAEEVKEDSGGGGGAAGEGQLEEVGGVTRVAGGGRFEEVGGVRRAAGGGARRGWPEEVGGDVVGMAACGGETGGGGCRGGGWWRRVFFFRSRLTESEVVMAHTSVGSMESANKETMVGERGEMMEVHIPPRAGFDGEGFRWGRSRCQQRVTSGHGVWMMLCLMDLNASPLPEDDEEYFEQHLGEHVTPHDQETSVQTLRREREERRERIRDHIDDRPMRVSRPPQRDEGPHMKKLKYDRNKLPPGWVECPNFGTEIASIVPSKVPLDESFNDCIPPGKRYAFRQVFHMSRVKNFKIGMVVDLTNTDRYYSTSDFKKEGIKYMKIRCQGRDSVPDNEAVNTFVFEVAQYIFNQSDRQPKKRVFLHCTHGHNRTGYMIVHYLMRTQQATSVTEAIQKFSKVRPPGIYKQDYIDSLYAFYHESKPDLITCPSTPEWKRSSDFDLNGEALPEDDDGVPYAPINEKQEDTVMITNDDVLGDKIPDEQEFQLRRFCLDMLKLPAPGRELRRQTTQISKNRKSEPTVNVRVDVEYGVVVGCDHFISYVYSRKKTRAHSYFPGSHPVSLDRENLQLLRQRYYYATWKADGTRYMLLLSSDGCFLVDRNFKFRRVQLRFPCKNMSEFHQFTLLDGEMIIDTISPEKQERRYLIYDLIAINRVSIAELQSSNNSDDLYSGGKELLIVSHWNIGSIGMKFVFFCNFNVALKLPFCERWKLIEKEVVEPRKNDRRAMDKHPRPPYRYDLEPFRVIFVSNSSLYDVSQVRRKDFWLLSTVGKVLKEFIPKLSHDADGLIFQGWDDPYVPRTHEGLLKWKYPEMNSVDFLFEVGEDGTEYLYLYDRGKKRLMDNNRVAFGDGFDTPSSYAGKIIECSWDSEEDVWVCMRVRVDKSTPNEFNTYRKDSDVLVPIPARANGNTVKAVSDTAICQSQVSTTLSSNVAVPEEIGADVSKHSRKRKSCSDMGEGDMSDRALLSLGDAKIYLTHLAKKPCYSATASTAKSKTGNMNEKEYGFRRTGRIGI
ncbi:hypothetical protein KSS87_015409 [Heliosperma pusillum]|nr:hypothetical protein KSS87_015409 [Heliosperma pusillum]